MCVSARAMYPETVTYASALTERSSVHFTQRQVSDAFTHRTILPHIAFASQQVVAALDKPVYQAEGKNGVVRLYDTHVEKLSEQDALLILNHDHVRVIAADKENRLLYSGSTDGTVKLFDLNSGRRPIRNFKGVFAPVQQIVPGQDGIVAIIQASMKSLCVVNAIENKLIADVLTTRRSSVYDASFHPTEERLIYSISKKSEFKPQYKEHDCLHLERLDYGADPVREKLDVPRVGPCSKAVVTYQPGTDMYRCGGAALGNSAPLYLGSDTKKMGATNWTVALPFRGGTCGTLQYSNDGSHLLAMMRSHKNETELVMHTLEAGKIVKKTLDNASSFYPVALAPDASCVIARKKDGLHIMPAFSQAD